MKIIFSGGENAKELIEKYNIKYVLVGEQEKNEFSANIRFFEENFYKLYDQDGYQIFSEK